MKEGKEILLEEEVPQALLMSHVIGK